MDVTINRTDMTENSKENKRMFWKKIRPLGNNKLAICNRWVECSKAFLNFGNGTGGVVNYHTKDVARKYVNTRLHENRFLGKMK